MVPDSRGVTQPSPITETKRKENAPLPLWDRIIKITKIAAPILLGLGALLLVCTYTPLLAPILFAVQLSCQSAQIIGFSTLAFGGLAGLVHFAAKSARKKLDHDQNQQISSHRPAALIADEPAPAPVGPPPATSTIDQERKQKIEASQMEPLAEQEKLSDELAEILAKTAGIHHPPPRMDHNLLANLVGGSFLSGISISGIALEGGDLSKNAR